jgi:hypothetical protein
MYLDGTREILAKSVPGQPKHHLVKRHQVTIAIGAPIYALEGENARRMAPRIEDAVIALSNGKAHRPAPELKPED